MRRLVLGLSKPSGKVVTSVIAWNWFWHEGIFGKVQIRTIFTTKCASCTVYCCHAGVWAILLGARLLLGRSAVDLDLLPTGSCRADEDLLDQPPVLGHDLPDHHAVDWSISVALAVVDGHHALADGSTGLDVLAPGVAEGRTTCPVGKLIIPCISRTRTELHLIDVYPFLYRS